MHGHASFRTEKLLCVHSAVCKLAVRHNAHCADHGSCRDSRATRKHSAKARASERTIQRDIGKRSTATLFPLHSRRLELVQNPKLFPAHKLVLAVASDVFKTMFYGSVPQENPVVIKDSTPSAFEAFLRFVVRNMISKVSFLVSSNESGFCIRAPPRSPTTKFFRF